jgi:nicotinate-nucleotide adenylyltransferase
MDKIAVFGGSFDPVHTAHTDIAKEALKIADVKKVVFVPAYAPPHKAEQFAAIEHRIAMLKLAVKNIKKTEISFFEAEKQDTVYSYQTLDYFRSLYPENEIVMIIGSDSLQELYSWKNAAYLAENYRFLVAKRPDIAVSGTEKYFDRCVFMDVVMKNISSSAVRELLKGGEDAKAKKLLSRGVYGYIREYGLYK